MSTECLPAGGEGGHSLLNGSTVAQMVERPSRGGGPGFEARSCTVGEWTRVVSTSRGDRRTLSRAYSMTCRRVRPPGPHLRVIPVGRYQGFDSSPGTRARSSSVEHPLGTREGVGSIPTGSTQGKHGRARSLVAVHVELDHPYALHRLPSDQRKVRRFDSSSVHVLTEPDGIRSVPRECEGERSRRVRLPPSRPASGEVVRDQPLSAWAGPWPSRSGRRGVAWILLQPSARSSRVGRMGRRQVLNLKIAGSIPAHGTAGAPRNPYPGLAGRTSQGSVRVAEKPAMIARRR